MPLVIILLTIAPPANVILFDRPNDAGTALVVTWNLSPDDPLVDKYIILRRGEDDTTYENVAFTQHGVSSFEDDGVSSGRTYTYIIAAVKDGIPFCSDPSNSLAPTPQWFHMGKLNIFAGIITLTILLLIFISKAKSGRGLFIRRIPGLEAVEEAVGRATEMGKPILYVPGLGDIDYTSTIASMNILGEVAKKIALYDTPLIVCNRWSVTYTVSKEVVKEAFVTEGRPDKFKEDYVRYLTEAQFGFAAAVNGIMVREKPATNFFIGSFWAESLIMAETGAQVGAIQISGTDQVHQLPFFVTACDYALIGEELYAASAYLSREPLLLGSLKAQDYGKVIVLVIMIVFTVLIFLGVDLLSLLRVE